MSALFRKLHPTVNVGSIFTYDFAAAYAAGKRLVLFDIDNTFVPHGAPADDKTKELIARLKEMGFSLYAISNNKSPRVRKFCDAVDVPFICKAGKPSGKGYREAMQRAGAAPAETIFFGDQIFTDIWGANRAGIESILVRPIDLSTDEIQIRIKRLLEKPFRKAIRR